MSAHIQKHVDKQKKEAEKKFSSWFMNKFKKNKTQYIRDQDEQSVEAERLRRQKVTARPSLPTSSSSKRESLNQSEERKSLQRQQSFLRAQLLEMKRHSHEVLMHAKSKGDSSEDEDYDDVHSELGDNEGEVSGSNNVVRKSRSRSRLRRKSEGNQQREGIVYDTDDEDEEKKGETDDEDNNHDESHGGGSKRPSLTSGTGSQRNSLTAGTSSQRNSMTGGSGSQRNSISEELDRRTSRATMLYEEALHAFDDILNPEQRVRNRTSRSDSAARKVFAKPENEWI